MVSNPTAGVLDEVRKMAPEIRSQAVQMDRDAKIPDTLHRMLVQTGCYRMLVPVAYGGGDASLPDVLRVIEELARADGSVGWTASQVASAQLILAHFPEAAIREVYSSGPDTLAAGAIAPKGAVERKDGSWHATGRWPFVSGCERAAWLYVNCVIQDTAKSIPTGTPEFRMLLFRATQAHIVRTWDVMGLRATASHDVRIHRAICPEERSCSLLQAVPSVDGAIFRVPLLEQGGLLIAAVALGIARGALEDIAVLAAGGKRPAFSPSPLATSLLFQDRLGEIYMRVYAASAMLEHSAELAWRAAAGNVLPDPIERAAICATPADVVATAVGAVDAAYTLAGGSAVYSDSSLQRRLRDIHTAAQHAYVGRQQYAALGAMLAAPNPIA